MKIFFLGAGPGDPELLTLKAEKIIKQAHIVIYAGSLVNKAILKLCRPGIPVHDSASMSFEEVTEIFAGAKEKEGIIARVHSGDPSLYGAVQEQIDWCRIHGIEFEVIPGVSSFSAAAAALKQELTLPGVSQSVIITRLSGRTDVPDREALSKLARAGATIVIFLSIKEINRVVSELGLEYPPDTPAAVVYRASWPDQKIIRATLATIEKKIRKSGITRQALIIVGDVLKKEYEKSKLYNKDFNHSFRKRRG